jgi:hypothetical protein
MLFYEKQLFRQIFTGEQKETHPFECSNLPTEGDEPHDFYVPLCAQHGTTGSTMEPEIRLHPLEE